MATEYHYHNLKTYTIEVVYFTKERLLEQFKTHLKAYRRCHLHRAEDDEEKRDLGKAASIAWHAFEAAFRNQNLLTKAYMLQENEQVLIDNFSSWIDGSAPLGYHEAAKHLSYIRRESIVDQEECSNRVMQLTSERSDGKVAASWPYIERVVYVPKLGAKYIFANNRKCLLKCPYLERRIGSSGSPKYFMRCCSITKAANANKVYMIPTWLGG